MKNHLLSSFTKQELYGSFYHSVRLYESSGLFYVSYRYVPMDRAELRSFNDEKSAFLFYTQKVLFLLS